MEKEVEKILKDYAEKRADDVFDISIDELRELVIDGGKMMHELLTNNTLPKDD